MGQIQRALSELIEAMSNMMIAVPLSTCLSVLFHLFHVVTKQQWIVIYCMIYYEQTVPLPNKRVARKQFPVNKLLF